MMKLNMVYLARVRELIGANAEIVSPPADISTLGSLLDWLAEQNERYKLAFENRMGLRAAINQNYAGWDANLSDGDEIAIFPPVTGG